MAVAIGVVVYAVWIVFWGLGHSGVDAAPPQHCVGGGLDLVPRRIGQFPVEQHTGAGDDLTR